MVLEAQRDVLTRFLELFCTTLQTQKESDSGVRVRIGGGKPAAAG